MPDNTFAAHVAQSVYGLTSLQVERLPPHFDWRGLFRLDDAAGNSWILRLLHGEEAIRGLAATARVLDWLALGGFPAPIVWRTSAGDAVGTPYGWASLLVSYIEGTVVRREPVALGLLAQTLGRLHALPQHAHTTIAPARSHPTTIAATAQRLQRATSHLPPAFHALADALHDAACALRELRGPLHLIHGDCWFQNAIQTPEGAVVLIDWDCVGEGLPLLDLAYLLLSSHFDFAQPLVVEADEPVIAAILHGYHAAGGELPHDRELLANAMRYLLAFQLGQIVADAEPVSATTERFLSKIKARYEATAAIASIAARYTLGKQA